jgi:hypothetical protein
MITTNDLDGLGARLRGAGVKFRGSFSKGGAGKVLLVDIGFTRECSRSLVCCGCRAEPVRQIGNVLKKRIANDWVIIQTLGINWKWGVWG